jgi:hypothetical protein
MIDGRDALLMVLVRPSENGGNVIVDAHCNGLDKLQAARILMHVAHSWRAEAERNAGLDDVLPLVDDNGEAAAAEADALRERDGYGYGRD